MRFWNPDPDNNPATSDGGFTLPTCPGTDPGLQQVTLELRSNDGFVTESLDRRAEEVDGVTRLRSSGDDGFTIVELVLAVTILGIIIVPLGNFILAYLDNVNETQARMSESHDMQIATAYFSQDVANVGLRGPTDPFPLLPSIFTSGFSCLPADGTGVVMLQWDKHDTATTNSTTVGTRRTETVTYYTKAGTLHRRYCPDPSDTTATTTPPPDSTRDVDLVLMHNVVSSSPPVVTCAPGACNAAPAVPTDVTLTVDLRGFGADENTSVVLKGHRRQGS